MADQYFLASRLKNTVMFLKRERVRQPNGSFDESWGDALSEPTWAEVVTIGGEEGRLAAAQSGSTRYRITLRYRADIDASMKVRLDTGLVVNVTAPPRDPDGRRVMLEVNAEYKEGSV